MQKPRLTVILRNISPFICLEEPVEHRTIHIEFTLEQLELLKPRKTGFSSGSPTFEQVSQCFIEET